MVTHTHTVRNRTIYGAEAQNEIYFKDAGGEGVLSEPEERRMGGSQDETGTRIQMPPLPWVSAS